MKAIFIFISLLFVTHLLFSQNRPSWNYYYGSDMTETKQKLNDYLSHYRYDGLFSQTDSTIELTITYNAATWTINSVFYFDQEGKCYAYSNSRCDSMGPINLQRTINNKYYRWKKIGNNKYISAFWISELLEIFESSGCTTTKRTKLKITRRQFKDLLAAKY